MDLNADYSGLNVPNEFIGYGLDYNEKYRNLPYVGIFETRGLRGAERKNKGVNPRWRIKIKSEIGRFISAFR